MMIAKNLSPETRIRGKDLLVGVDSRHRDLPRRRFFLRSHLAQDAVIRLIERVVSKPSAAYSSFT